MAPVRLILLGPPRLELVEGEEVGRTRLGAKSLALLAYLALESGPHTRSELAGLLWGESPDDAARASLRQALRQLRGVLGSALKADRRSVELSPAVSCDAAEFRRRVRTTPEAALELDPPRFLTGVAVRRAPAFEEWADATGSQLTKLYCDALRDAVRQGVTDSRWRDAATLADRWIACEPLSEEAVRLAAEAYHLARDRGAALARLSAYESRLEREAGVPPSAAFRALADRVRADERRAQPAPSNGDEEGVEFEVPLVGRSELWRALIRRWEEVARGQARLVLLEGEAGIGKTRLAEDFLSWAGTQGATVLRGRAYGPVAGVPYAPMVDALGGALDAPGLAGVAPAWLADAARLVPALRERFRNLPRGSGAGTEADRRWRLFEAVAQVIIGLAAERPTVLFIDDVEGVDPMTCALLQFLARRFEETPVLVLLSFTLGELERASSAARLDRGLRSDARCTVLSLQPLSLQDVLSLLSELGRVARDDFPQRFAARIHAVTDGNPFHLVELLKALFAQGLLATDPETGAWVAGPSAGQHPSETIPLPVTVHEAISARCARLPYELRDLLAVVAVADGPVPTDVLSRMLGASRLRVAALGDALVERRLLAAEAGAYRCAHPVIQDVVRSELTTTRKHELHRALAIALDELDRPEFRGEVARHAERGGEAGLAYRSALAAAATADERGAFDEALGWLDLAERVVPPGAAAEIETRRLAILAAAGWTELPASPRRAGTPARGLMRRDLDLGASRS